MTDTSFTDDIEQLLALERTRSDEPSVMIDRLRDRLSMTLGLDGALEHALESAKSGADASHAASGASRATATASTAGAGALTGTKIALVALGAFAVGAVSGAKWQSGRSEPPPSDNVPSVVAPTATATHAASVAPSASVLASADAGIAVDISSLPLVKPSAPTQCAFEGRSGSPWRRTHAHRRGPNSIVARENG